MGDWIDEAALLGNPELPEFARPDARRSFVRLILDRDLEMPPWAYHPSDDIASSRTVYQHKYGVGELDLGETMQGDVLFIE